MSTSSSNAAVNRVVSLNSRGRDRSPGQRMLGECREQLIDALGTWLREVAVPVSEELLKLADGTRDREQQARYIDLRADIEKDWTPLVERFRRQLASEAQRVQSRFSEDDEPPPPALEIPDFEGLALLDDDDLSEHIVIREFSIQLSETCDDELYTLNRRVATLLGQEDVNDDANPLAPAVVCRALSEACTTIGKDAETRLLLLRRLERHLHSGLPPIYLAINDYLIERGILPELRRNFRKNANEGELNSSGYRYQGAGNRASAGGGPSGGGGGGGANNGGRGGATSGMGAQGGAAGSAPMSNEGILEALQRLVQTRIGQLPPAAPMLGTLSMPVMPGMQGMPVGMAGMPVGPAVGFQNVALDTASLNQFLQASLQNMPTAPVTAGETGAPIVNQVRMVRDSENAQQVSGLASVTIDIVAMLFDFIFDDAHIPVAIKALISRLQIPVLKVAMLNPGFFADRQHPTRRFLGSVAGISIRWGTSVDETDPFYCKLAELVERIQAEFEEDIEIFGTALSELEVFVSENESAEESTALSAANVVMQREQEADTWERAQRAVHGFCRNNELPELISSFLGEHWVAVLQAVAATDGEDGENWKAAKATMQDLAWSVEAKKAPEDRARLIGLLPGLLARLNRGLDSIDAATDQRSAFFDALVKCHAAALRSESPPEAPVVEPPPAPTENRESNEAADVTEANEVAEALPPAPPEEGDLLVTRSVDNGIEVEEVMLVGASPIWRADEREILRQVNELRRGDWIEFRDEEGLGNRVRLHWISPQKGILLFSNHRSAKAISIAPEALARQIRDGKADFVRDNELFERALSGALESLSAG